MWFLVGLLCTCSTFDLIWWHQDLTAVLQLTKLSCSLQRLGSYYTRLLITTQQLAQREREWVRERETHTRPKPYMLLCVLYGFTLYMRNKEVMTLWRVNSSYNSTTFTAQPVNSLFHVMCESSIFLFFRVPLLHWLVVLVLFVLVMMWPQFMGYLIWLQWA